MKEKSILFLLLFSIICHAQNYTLDKSKEFIYPELKIESPVDQFKMFIFARDYNTLNTEKIKSVFSNKTLTEYDIKGNIIRISSSDKFYDKTTILVYRNGILTEKKMMSKVHKENVEKKIKEQNKKAQADMERNGIATVENLESEDTESIYKIELDKKERIISKSWKDYKIIDGEKNLIKDSNTKIEYSGNKITSIKTGNSESFFEEKYFYDGNLLIGKEGIDGGTDAFRYQKTKTIHKYLYDKRKNLIALYDVNEYYINGKRSDDNKLSLRDSAIYDEKNRIIWHGYKYRYETFKYDNNDNVIEFSKFNKNKLEEKLNLKQVYEFDTKNNIIKFTEIDFRTTSPYSSVRKLIYKNGLLKEIQNSSEKTPIGGKFVYEYDDKNRLTKKSEFVPKRFLHKNAKENEFDLGDETTYLYGNKSLVVKNKYGNTIAEYTFY